MGAPARSGWPKNERDDQEKVNQASEEVECKPDDQKRRYKHRNLLFRFLRLALALVRASSRNPEALPRLPKSPQKAGERGAGPFARAADGLSRPFLAVAMASAANRPFDTLSASPMPGRQNFADDLDTLAHAKVGPSCGRTRRLR